MQHTIDIRVYYEDTDAGGIVYHSNFLNFAERGRCELLRDLGHEASKVEKEFGMMFVIKHADIEYIAPAVLDDALQVVTTVAEMNNTSFKMRQIVRKDGQDICEMMITAVCVDIKTVKPVRLPDILREQFAPYLEEES